ncbi:hypothetical protein PSHT_04129 [Puccinia striiformis]|uniref:Uncharacterized protein n=1 Tax=Puccinia striiformis TaxID=27350 RepID=A0A2S4WDZ0_9BASI|nr:hypothetical protein PSHT_04129 [Puccinia striiformis]
MSRDVQTLMKKFEYTAEKGRPSLAKKGRLSKILIDDYTQNPPYTAQFLQDYYVNMNDFLSELNGTEKDTFWEFRESYEKYSAIGSIASMTHTQTTQCASALNFAENIRQSPHDQIAFASMQEKIACSPAAENDSRQANHKKTLTILASLGKSEIYIYFRRLEYLMNDFHQESEHLMNDFHRELEHLTDDRHLTDDFHRDLEHLKDDFHRKLEHLTDDQHLTDDFHKDKKRTFFSIFKLCGMFGKEKE